MQISITRPSPRTILRHRKWALLALLVLALTIASGHDSARPAAASGGVAAVTTGANHTCALVGAGAGWCWGSNNNGQLGDGTTTDSTSPLDVLGLTSGAGAIATGRHHTCAVTTAGGVKCWGWNFGGALGDGTTTDRTTPVDVCATGATPPCTSGNNNILTGVAAGVDGVAAGFNHTCAVTAAGGLKCWGHNASGQVGSGAFSPANITTPVDVVGLTSGVLAADGGDDHTCALTTAGGVKCWGANALGQLGDGTTTASASPVDASPNIDPWFPWDTDNDGEVGFGDFLKLLQHYNQTKP